MPPAPVRRRAPRSAVRRARRAAPARRGAARPRTVGPLGFFFNECQYHVGLATDAHRASRASRPYTPASWASIYHFRTREELQGVGQVAENAALFYGGMAAQEGLEKDLEVINLPFIGKDVVWTLKRLKNPNKFIERAARKKALRWLGNRLRRGSFKRYLAFRAGYSAKDRDRIIKSLGSEGGMKKMIRNFRSDDPKFGVSDPALAKMLESSLPSMGKLGKIGDAFSAYKWFKEGKLGVALLWDGSDFATAAQHAWMNINHSKVAATLHHMSNMTGAKGLLRWPRVLGYKSVWDPAKMQRVLVARGGTFGRLAAPFRLWNKGLGKVGTAYDFIRHPTKQLSKYVMPKVKGYLERGLKGIGKLAKNYLVKPLKLALKQVWSLIKRLGKWVVKEVIGRIISHTVIDSFLTWLGATLGTIVPGVGNAVLGFLGWLGGLIVSEAMKFIGEQLWEKVLWPTLQILIFAVSIGALAMLGLFFLNVLSIVGLFSAQTLEPGQGGPSGTGLQAGQFDDNPIIPDALACPLHGNIRCTQGPFGTTSHSDAHGNTKQGAIDIVDSSTVYVPARVPIDPTTGQPNPDMPVGRVMSIESNRACTKGGQTIYIGGLVRVRVYLNPARKEEGGYYEVTFVHVTPGVTPNTELRAGAALGEMYRSTEKLDGCWDGRHAHVYTKDQNGVYLNSELLFKQLCNFDPCPS